MIKTLKALIYNVRELYMAFVDTLRSIFWDALKNTKTFFYTKLSLALYKLIVLQ